MMVSFVDKENPNIIIKRDYTDILPLLELIKQKAVISIYLDQNGDKRVNGRFYDYEYTVEENEESLLVIIDSSYNNVTK